MIKSSSDTNSALYYREQVSQLETKIKEYLSKIDKLNETNKALQKEIAKSHTDELLESKYMELENKHHELNRKISQLTLHNTTLQTDVTRLTSEIESLSQENQKLRRLEYEKSHKNSNTESMIKEIKQKNIEL